MKQVGSNQSRAFFKFLGSLHDVPGALASLRRCVSLECLYSCSGSKYLYGFLQNKNIWQRRCYVALAALYAHHQNYRDGDPVGACLAKVISNGQRKISERRMVQFLRSDDEILFVRLRGIVKLAMGYPLNWADLLDMLIHWQDERQWTQNKIAEDFATQLFSKTKKDNAIVAL